MKNRVFQEVPAVILLGNIPSKKNINHIWNDLFTLFLEEKGFIALK